MPATISLSDAAVSQTYLENKHILDNLATHFHFKHGGDLDDLKGEADEYFMDAYKAFQDEVIIKNERTKEKDYYSPFPIYLRMKVAFRFLDKARSLATKLRGYQQDFGYDVEWTADKKLFNLTVFMLDLSEDAKFVAWLALDPPKDVEIVAKQNKGPDFGCNVRAGIVSYLSDIGWDRHRIWGAFEEIQETLPK
jgi:hypothetical protein